MKYIFLSLATLVGSISAYAQTTNQKETTNTKKDSLNGTILHEVVVSASREKQQRSEVPAAISVINSKKINETKAFGIDQLVNDTPGVYMSTSRSSSNEQHFTAVRSPISTKPLFLFLEDGLPIRPTSIFNHNALLELNTISHQRIEILRGPNASIYGSDAIGGSFNFITKDPTKELTGHLAFQANELGYSSVSFDAAKQITNRFGLYVGTQFNQRNNGPFEHSDYDKYALTLKAVIKPLNHARLSVIFTGTDFLSDMAGSVGEKNFFLRNFQSDQTFTNRDTEAYRLRTTWEQSWDNNNKTSFSVIYRDNEMKQNPSFRIRQNRNDTGGLTGAGSGEVNNNSFKSYFGNIQHQSKLIDGKLKIITGGTIDHTKQDYVSEKTDVVVDAETRKNIGFSVREGDFILNYDADIDNYAGYAQIEFSPIEKLSFTGGLRYDYFEYDFNNRKIGVDELEDRKDDWDNLAPKIGVNYNLSNSVGFYANYSQGFTPPQSSTLYRGRDENEGIKPSQYDNYEVGGYSHFSNKIRLDLSLYVLKGKNTLISVRNEGGDTPFTNTNAGETTSYGIEYGISYKPIKEIELTHNGTYAKHEYDEFVFRGDDFSDTHRETAPNLIGTSKIKIIPGNGLNMTFEHELIGDYATSLEGQAKDTDGNPNTTTYAGHNIFNFLTSYQYKKVEVWMHVLNVFDRLYANRVSYNRFRNENSFTAANPRAFHIGIKYNF
ncbi:TonB-dependent receptor [Aquimarina agarilytica]|uniref:TonB-dependent receptor n=1 Tax=Aquimarina agarilytica TaxID=1087449 RepID=UPI000287B180|nr:TonB-dependent receptor [Aquimarina agarilytica]